MRIVVFDITEFQKDGMPVYGHCSQLFPIDEFHEEGPKSNRVSIVVFNKLDLHEDVANRAEDYAKLKEEFERNSPGVIAVHFMSCEKGEGVSEFLGLLELAMKQIIFSSDARYNGMNGHMAHICSGGGGGTIITRARHRKHLKDTAEALKKCLDSLNVLEISSEHAKQGIDSLGRITGRVDIEDVLDVLFTDFCIGK